MGVWWYFGVSLVLIILIFIHPSNRLQFLSLVGSFWVLI